MSSFPDNFSATKSSSEGTKNRGKPGVGFSSAFGKIYPCTEFEVSSLTCSKFTEGGSKI